MATQIFDALLSSSHILRTKSNRLVLFNDVYIHVFEGRSELHCPTGRSGKYTCLSIRTSDSGFVTIPLDICPHIAIFKEILNNCYFK